MYILLNNSLVSINFFDNIFNHLDFHDFWHEGAVSIAEGAVSITVPWNDCEISTWIWRTLILTNILKIWHLVAQLEIKIMWDDFITNLEN